MNTVSTFWSRRRNRVIAVTVGAGLAGVVLVGGVVADAYAATTSADPGAAAVVPAAATTATPMTPGRADAARLRAAILGVRALPVAQRPAAFLQLKADVLAGKYGAKAKSDLAAIDAVLASDPAGLRGALLRLAAAHPHRAAPSATTLTPTPTVSPAPTS